jgi:dihydroorotate dehydrogenase (fumarate)
MDLSTTYLGFKLANPLMAGASPMADDLDMVRRLEDAGSSAIVMYSLFEEQIVTEEIATSRYVESPAESFAEAVTYFPAAAKLAMGVDDYLEQIRHIKQAVKIPVVGSLNGVTPGGWLDHAKEIEQAGADAIELNTYRLATNPDESGEVVESRTVEMLKRVASAVKIPIAVKLSPFYSSLANFVQKLKLAGADGVVLFNRFYQPDIDTETMTVDRTATFSSSSELLLRLHWLAILSGRLDLSLAATGGVHIGLDVIKTIMSGADAVQMVSALLINGPDYLRTVKNDFERWMEQHEYNSLAELKGTMAVQKNTDPNAFERINYVEILKGWTMKSNL